MPGMPSAADTKILEEARERFELVHTNDKDNRDNYKADLAFVYSPGAQWPDDVRSKRKAFGDDVCLEFNQLKPFTAQVVNDQLQERPGIRVHAAGGDASEDVAEIEQGMIRSIEYESKADDVYKNAFKLAVVGGRGWCRVVSEYESDDGFNQRLAIKPVQDSNTVYASTDYQMPDGSDRPYLFVAETHEKAVFLAKYPDAEPVSWDQIDTYWADGKETVVVVDYYRRVCKKRTLVMMTDGAKGWLDEMPEPPEGITIARKREVEVWSVEWYTIAGGQQILETHEWPGTIIPVVHCAGEDIILEGKRVYQGLIRHARDAQSALNYGMTMQAMQLALAPRAPWVMAEGQNEGYENMWRDANTKNWSALVYKPTTIEGVVVPPPQRTQPAMISEGFDRWCQMMLSMIKSTIGIYENSLGQKSQETSRVAIVAKEKQGDTATYNYVNNWHMMIDLIGRIIVEVMPTFYDTERIVNTIGIDDVKKLVTINQAGVEQGPDGALMAIKNNDITKGQYAVTVEAGPSFATKREESREALTQFVQAFPPAAAVAGDLLVKALDLPDADILAERLKMTLPPQVLQAEQAKEQGKAPPDPQMQAKLQEQQQHLDQAAQTMEAMQQEIQKLQSGQEAKMAAVQSDAQIKTQSMQVDAELKDRQSQMDAQIAVQKSESEARTAIQQAQIDAQTTLQKTAMEQETAIRKAMIERMTKLQIAEMQDDTARETASMQDDTNRETAVMHNETAKETAAESAKEKA